MPTIEVRCSQNHSDVRYLHTWAYRDHVPPKVCHCGLEMHEVPSFGTPLTYFSEKTPRYIDNLEATIRSHGQHVRRMKERGVEPATDWHTSRSISDGLKTNAKKPHWRESKRAKEYYADTQG